MENHFKRACALLAIVFLSSCGTDATLTVVGAPPAARGEALMKLMNLGFGRMESRVASGDPTSVKINFIAFYVSANADCTGAVEAANLGSPVSKDLYQSPVLFTGSPAAASYPCVIIKMQDILTFTPDAAAVTAHTPDCASGTEYTGEIYRAGQSDSNLWKDETGAAITATGDGTKAGIGADTVTIFATTTPSAATAGALGVHTNQLLTLTSALVVPGQTTFVADFSDKVDGGGGDCGLEKGTFKFQ
jgi:hypothetical protein